MLTRRNESAWPRRVRLVNSGPIHAKAHVAMSRRGHAVCALFLEFQAAADMSRNELAWPRRVRRGARRRRSPTAIGRNESAWPRRVRQAYLGII